MKNKKTIIGHVKRHPDGFGFFIPDDINHPDVYIPRKDMVGVMSNDKIEIEVKPEPGGDRFRGKIISIVERGMENVTGQIHRMTQYKGILNDTSHAWGENLHVNFSSDEKFNDGDWVSVEIVSYPGSPKGFSGKLVKVIGDSLNPFNDTMRVLYQSEIPVDFSPSCISEAEQLGSEVLAKDIEGRKDLRNENLITIDGMTAKDFDDAILVKQQGKGFNLLVAIADVSHYVKPGSAIDEDAYKRGTSTYFPNFVAPMLPEALSNELCSLKPDVDRLAVVADMNFDFSGNLESSSFYEAVIQSKARVTYGEAQEIIDGNNIEKFNHVKADILKAADLAKIFMAKRFREGSLDLELPETTIEVDDLGQPVDIIKSERLFAHKLIEEMMLSANVAVAKFFKSKSVPGFYRIHEPPDQEAIKKLEGYMHNFGFQKKLMGGKLQKNLTKALQEFHGKPQHHILSILTLRTMSQAKYSEDNVGHFGLGFSDYSHFTSPIRRYPDLIVHRQIKSIVCKDKGYHQIPEEKLASAGSVLSACEQRSVKAERKVQAIKKARFMEKFVGQKFEGVISSVAKFGIFVVLRQYDVDGLIRIEELGDDHFEFDEENLCLRGKRSGKSYNLGDIMEVLVAAADPDEGRIDFALDDRYIPPTPRTRGKEVGKSKPRVRGKEVGKSKPKKKEKDKKPSKKRLTLKTNSRGLRKARVSKSSRKGKAR